MAAPEAVELRPAVVVVVEDEFLVRTEVSEALQSAGYTVFEAADCSEALELLAMHPESHVLLTDIAMPGLIDGNDLIRVVRREHPNLIVVAATEAAAYGRLEGVLRKPYDPSEAVLLVGRLLVERARAL
jgi:CheY-like chemotaxis protein